MESPRTTTSVVDALALGEERYLFIIGGGGKSALIAALVRELGSQRRVIATTSTKMRCAEGANGGQVIICDDLPQLIARLEQRPSGTLPLTIAKAELSAERKLCGFSVEELDQILDAGVADCLIVEADGAAGRSLKAHADYEPVVSPRADLVVAVIGVDCVGKPLSDEHVHRAERFRALLGRDAGGLVTSEDVVAIFFHPAGYLRAIRPRTPVTVLISKASSEADRAIGRGLAEGLLAADRDRRIGGIAIGDLRDIPALEIVTL